MPEPLVHWEWLSDNYKKPTVLAGYRLQLCKTSEHEREQEWSVILRPLNKRTKKPPVNECEKCRLLGTEAGIP